MQTLKTSISTHETIYPTFNYEKSSKSINQESIILTRVEDDFSFGFAINFGNTTLKNITIAVNRV